jgi:transcriptional regulator with XRE-family HTH domain
MRLDPLLSIIDMRRRELGFSERQLCFKAGLKRDAVRTIRRGHPPTLSKLRSLADALGLSLNRLSELAPDIRLDEVITSPDLSHREEVPSAPGQRQAAGQISAPTGYVYVPRLVKERVDPEFTGLSAARLYPERLIRLELQGQPEDFWSSDIEGSVMDPVLRSRDEVLIDLRLRTPTQPGLFSLDEGLGPVVRWVEFVPGSIPARYRVRAEDPRVQAYEVQPEAAQMVGRVVWFARRL